MNENIIMQNTLIGETVLYFNEVAKYINENIIEISDDFYYFLEAENKNFFQKIWENIVNFFKTIWNAISNLFSSNISKSITNLGIVRQRIRDSVEPRKKMTAIMEKGIENKESEGIDDFYEMVTKPDNDITTFNEITNHPFCKNFTVKTDTAKILLDELKKETAPITNELVKLKNNKFEFTKKVFETINKNQMSYYIPSTEPAEFLFLLITNNITAYFCNITAITKKIIQVLRFIVGSSSNISSETNASNINKEEAFNDLKNILNDEKFNKGLLTYVDTVYQYMILKYYASIGFIHANRYGQYSELISKRIKQFDPIDYFDNKITFKYIQKSSNDKSNKLVPIDRPDEYGITEIVLSSWNTDNRQIIGSLNTIEDHIKQNSENLKFTNTEKLNEILVKINKINSYSAMIFNVLKIYMQFNNNELRNLTSLINMFNKQDSSNK